MNGVTANMTEEKEKALKMWWPVPPGDFGMATLSTNATIVDKGGKILAWVLPGTQYSTISLNTQANGRDNSPQLSAGGRELAHNNTSQSTGSWLCRYIS